MSNRKENRSPQEIVKAMEADLAKAKARAAMKDAESLPEIQVLTETLADVKAEKLVAKRKFSGPQSFKKRLAKHSAWMSEIEAGETLALELVDGFNEQEVYLKAEIARLIGSYTRGDLDATALEIAADRAVEDMPTFSEDVTYVQNWDEAHRARVLLTSKVSKDKEDEAEA